MRTITMTGGPRVTLDGDLLTLLETLYRELTARRELERTFEDTVREIHDVIEQMTEDERRQYLSESLFLNFVSYENERLGAYLKKLTVEKQKGKRDKGDGRALR
jgi:CRISPR/Cas system-associated protein Csm6